MLNSRTRILHSLIYCPSKKGDRKRETDKGREAALNRLLKNFNAIVGRPFFFFGADRRAQPPALLPGSRAARPTRAGGSLSIGTIGSRWKGEENPARERVEARGLANFNRGQNSSADTSSRSTSTNNKTSNRPCRALCW